MLPGGKKTIFAGITVRSEFQWLTLWITFHRKDAERVGRRISTIFKNIHETPAATRHLKSATAQLLETEVKVGQCATVDFFKKIFRPIKFRGAHRLQAGYGNFERFAFDRGWGTWGMNAFFFGRFFHAGILLSGGFGTSGEGGGIGFVSCIRAGFRRRDFVFGSGNGGIQHLGSQHVLARIIMFAFPPNGNPSRRINSTTTKLDKRSPKGIPSRINALRFCFGPTLEAVESDSAISYAKYISARRIISG